MKVKAVISFVCLSMIATVFGISPSSAVSTPPVSVTPSSSAAISAGQSVTLSFALDNPIQCNGSTPCDVTVNFTVSDPNTVSLSASSVNWQPGSWMNPTTITITANPNLTYRNSSSVKITGTVVSASTHFSAYTFTYTQAITLPSRRGHCHNG